MSERKRSVSGFSSIMAQLVFEIIKDIFAFSSERERVRTEENKDN